MTSRPAPKGSPVGRGCYDTLVPRRRAAAGRAIQGTLLAEPEFDRGAARPTRDPYPTTAGLALLGTMWHEAAVRLFFEALDRHFDGREDVLIASELALYYEPAPLGGQGLSVVPDLMVVLGASAHGRESYKIWEEGGRVPQFVLEVASVSTKDRDLGFKKEAYESLGVREYWQLDQSGKLLPQTLMGHRLRRGRYWPVGPAGRAPDGEREYRSVELGLLLRPKFYREGWIIACRAKRSGKDIPVGPAVTRSLRETEERQRQAEADKRRAEERQRRAEERQRRAEERQRQAEERQRQAEAEKRRAEERQREERVARLAAEEQVAELLRKLGAKG